MPVIGSGPFEFTDLKGSQTSIPLGSLEFGNTGKVKVIDSWPALNVYSGAQKDVIAALLAEQQKADSFSKIPVASAKSAMVISAADNGVLGDEIEITIATTPNADPFEATFDVKAEQSETYTDLTVDTIADVLGTEVHEGSKPGLAHVLSGSVSSADPPPLPAEISDAPFSSAHSRLVILDESAAPVFTLEARKQDPDAQFLKATIHIDTVAGTFTLDLKWSRTAPGVKLGTIDAGFAALHYLVTAAKPPDSPFAVPKSVDSLALSGGTESAKASAVITAL